MRRDWRILPDFCKIRRVPQDEFVEHDMLDDGVEQEVAEADQASEN